MERYIPTMQKVRLTEPPVAILLTLPVAFFKDRNMTCEDFKKYFERVMSRPTWVWNFKLTNLPTRPVAWVYLVFGGFVQYKLNFVMYQRFATKTFKDSIDNKERVFKQCNWVIMTGPPIKAPFEIPQRGFQGFRYSKELF